MKAEIINTGTELLLGQILNRNAQYLSQRLSQLGIDVYYHTTVGDNPARIAEAISQALQRSEIVITTGGLGPTNDDLTKEMVAEVLGLEMVEDASSLARIEGFFADRGRVMPKNNTKQACFPDGAIIMPNDFGTAPGAIVEKGEKVVIILPGPPFELEPMFETSAYSYLQKLSGGRPTLIKSRVLRLFGIGESTVEERIKDLLDSQTNPTIAPLAKATEINLRLTAKGSNEEQILKMIKPVEEELRNRLGEYIFGADEVSLEKVVGNLLEKHELTLATAESCTGGLLAAKITDVPGSSAYFHYGLVTYSNEAKMKLLRVREETLNNCGAVSEATAREMAQGVRILANADLGVAVTGIAGPGGGTVEKPVGLVYIALASENNIICQECRFLGDRETIRGLTVNTALNMVRVHLRQVNSI